MRRTLSVAMGSMVAACGASVESAQQLKSQDQLVVETIADKCDVPKKAWKLVGPGEVTLVGGMDNISSGTFMCFLKGLESSEPPIRLGFIAEPPQGDRQ